MQEKQINRFHNTIPKNLLPDPLPEEERRRLEQMTKFPDQAGEEARDKLAQHSIRLALFKCNKFDESENEDYLSDALYGLVKARDTYDANKGRPFNTYAGRCIMNEILMERRKLVRREGKCTSLNNPIGIDNDGNELTLDDVLPAEINIEDRIGNNMMAGSIIELMSVLSEIEKKVINLRYGLNGSEGTTQAKIAGLLGISRSYVSRIETKALKKMRKEAKKKDITP